MNPAIYSAVILFLAVTGLIFACQFILTHRPKHWRRWQALDASGWVIIVVIAYVRTVILVLWTWPGTPHSIGSAAIGISLTVLVDLLMVLRVVAYARYRRLDKAVREREKE